MSGKRSFDREKLVTKSLSERCSRVTEGMLFRPPPPGASAADFARSLPDVLAVRSLWTTARALLEARESGSERLLMYGGHVIKCGLGPLLVRWLRRGVVSSLATNGAGTIHDLEMALFGATSEDVQSGISDGSFGMWRETGEVYAAALSRSSEGNAGLGESLGVELLERGADPDNSPLAAAALERLPVTVHPALGGDIVHPHPNVSWRLIGEAAERDFDLLGGRVARLGGGVVMNVGSAVVMPEVFLKLLTSARNLGFDVGGFLSVDMDMTRHYRPTMNVVRRPACALGGSGISLTGHHEIMLPLLDLLVRSEEEGA